MDFHSERIKDHFNLLWINFASLFVTILSIILPTSGILIMLSERLLKENRELATVM